MGNKSFVNPYNFVSSNFKSKSKAQRERGNLTGVIHCQLKTITPLAIPDVESLPENTYEDGKIVTHPVYTFFQENNQPVIPGSSLRGPIRSMFETLTDSCYSTTEVKDAITFRGNIYSPGILKKIENGYELYKAQRYVFIISSQEVKYKPYRKNKPPYILNDNVIQDTFGVDSIYKLDGTQVSFETKGGKKIQSLDSNEETYGNIGILCIDEPFGEKNSKYFESVFKKDSKIYNSIGLEKAVKLLENIKKEYNKATKNKQLKKEHEFYGYRNYDKMESGDELPVWYKFDSENKIHLSYANVGRSAYHKDMNELLGSKVPCSSSEELCEACALFGMIKGQGVKKGTSIGSRIRITDARLKENMNKGKDLYINGITLKELASPNPSYIPLYMERGNESSKLSDGYDGPGAQIRGRKFYWHNQAENAYMALKDENGNSIKTIRNATMDLVNKEIIFEFDVYFDRIREEQLKKLVWTLTLGENKEDGNQCYKIGHGKSIGLGSCKITIDKIEKRVFENGLYDTDNESYMDIDSLILSIEDDKDSFDQNAKEEVLIISNLESIKETVEYPKVVNQYGEIYLESIEGYSPNIKFNNDYASHKWFSKNFKLGENTEDAKMLPKITEKDTVLLEHYLVLDESLQEEGKDLQEDVGPKVWTF